MTEIKIQTPMLTYRFEEDGGVDDWTDCFKSLLDNKKDYVDDYDNKAVIIPYSVLKKSIITIINLK